ncbi:hypothetical protein MMC30_006009 [Trapelia coarctata]|nr:hypothetical protein [Trapelia coarctata]
MQLNFLLAAVASILPIQVAAQYYALPTSIALSQAPKLYSDINAYYSSIAASPAYTSAVSVLKTGTVNPKTINFAASPTNWYTALPTEVQPYFSSVQAAVYSIIKKDAIGAAPAGAGVKYTAMVAAGAMAAIALL